jgi:hypothetical protein
MTREEDELTPAQEVAVQAFTVASRLLADAWPLPDVPFLVGISGGERHAIDREFFDGSRRLHGGKYAHSECGRPVLYASQYPIWAGTWPPHVRWCADCAWTVAAHDGDLERQVRALIPPDALRPALTRLMADPLIAVKAAVSIIEAAESGYGDHDAGDPEMIRVLAAITRHQPVILVTEDCADGECGHGADGIGERCAAVACGVQRPGRPRRGGAGRAVPRRVHDHRAVRAANRARRLRGADAG